MSVRPAYAPPNGVWDGLIWRRAAIPIVCAGCAFAAAFAVYGQHFLKVVYALILAAAVVWMLRHRRRTDALDPVLLFGLFYVLFVCGGPLVQPVFNSLEPRLDWLCIIGLGAFVAGAVFSDRCVAAPGVRHIRAPALTFVNTWDQRKTAVLVGLMAAAGSALAAVFLHRVGGIPVLFEEMDKQRTEAMSGNVYFAEGIIVLLPQAALVALASALHAGSRRAIWVSAALCLYALAIMVLTGHRQPILYFALSVFLVISALTRGLRTWQALALCALLAYGASAYAGLRAESLKQIGVTSWQVVRHVAAWEIYVVADNLRMVRETFPRNEDYALGRGYWMDISAVLPGPDETFGKWMTRKLHIPFEGGTIVSVNGELWVNFGPAGVVLGLFVLGAALRAVHLRFLYAANRSIYHLLLMVAFAAVASGLPRSGITSPLTVYVLPIMSILYLLNHFLRYRHATGAVA